MQSGQKGQHVSLGCHGKRQTDASVLIVVVVVAAVAAVAVTVTPQHPSQSNKLAWPST